MLNKCNFLFNPFIIFIMLANFNKNFEQLIIQLNIDQCYQKFIKQGSEMYKIKQYNV